MAVITRKYLTGQAQEIAQKGIQQQINAGNQALIQLQQQRSIIDAQQASLVAATQQTLSQVESNIYQARRQRTAQQAMLGMVGDISTVRDATMLQDQISQDLSNVISQAEQGAVNIAGQQSAINQAEVQTAADSILDQYTNTLIEEGNVAIERDYARETLAGVTGAITGAIKGAIGAWGSTWGLKTLLSPTSGFIKKAIAGGTLTGVLPSMLVGDIKNLATNITQHTGTELNWDEDSWKTAKSYLMLGGALTGATFFRGLTGQRLTKDAIKELKPGENFWYDLTTGERAAAKGSKFGGLFPKKGTKMFQTVSGEAVKSLSTAGKIGNFSKRVANTITGSLRVNPILMATSVGLGALIGGLTAGLDKKYKLNMDELRGQDTAQQFADMGIDLSALADKVKNY